MEPLPGRTCDGCTVCCTIPALESGGFSKPPGVTCAQCDGRGCAIYEARPEPCRAFECGWRLLPIVPPGLRPSTSGVMVAADHEAVPGYRDMAPIKFIFITDAAITDAALLECIAGLVHARAPVFVAAPGPAGHHPLKTLINPRIEHAVAQRDGQAIARTLTGIIANLRQGPFEPA